MAKEQMPIHLTTQGMAEFHHVCYQERGCPYLYVWACISMFIQFNRYLNLSLASDTADFSYLQIFLPFAFRISISPDSPMSF